MTWRKMTIEEYADFELLNGAKLFKVHNVWWREVRPFFYRPLYPFVSFQPGSMSPPKDSFLGGFQHIVPGFDLANSYMNFMVFDDIHDYSIKKLKHGYRKNIKKALRHLVIKQSNDFDEFVTKGHEIYLSFYERTKYAWKKERIHKDSFYRWAKGLFCFNKLLILGAYFENKLCAISVSCLVNDVIMYKTVFSNSECLGLRVSELMLHVIRDMAAGCKDVKYIYMGMPKSKQSLDNFKMSRGCRIIAEPAYLKINPLVYHLTRRFRQNDYIKLVGQNRDELDYVLKTR